MIQQQWEILGNRKPRSVPEVLEILLENRGAEPSFLEGELKDLEPHLDMRGMEEGARLMAGHLFRGNKLVLVGDYDCDGVTSTAQLALFLNTIGHRNYQVVIPNRSEGYGIPERALSENPDAQLLVALDCGTHDVGPVSAARTRGIDCIVIDHHEVKESELARANVLINPKQRECPSRFKEFCSSGLTLLFLASLRRAVREKFGSPTIGAKHIILAAIGTVADMVPLTDANRVLARAGIAHLRQRRYLPVNKIAELAGLAGKEISAGHIAYYLGPRINAAGRMASAHIAFDLLTQDDPREIERLALELNRLNARRQSEEESILKEVRERYAKEGAGRRTLVMADSKWPAGIVGIVASRIQQELHYGPTIVFSIDEAANIARGSARSIAGFNLQSALRSCDPLLIKWGGHKMAAGLKLETGKLEAFADRFEEVARQHDPQDFIPRGKVDMEIDLTLVSKELLEALKELEPHGVGNPTPLFTAREAQVTIQNVFGKKQDHVRLLLNDRLPAIFWKGADRFRTEKWGNGDRMDVVFQLEWDRFLGKPAANIKDIGRIF